MSKPSIGRLPTPVLESTPDRAWRDLDGTHKRVVAVVVSSGELDETLAFLEREGPPARQQGGARRPTPWTVLLIRPGKDLNLRPAKTVSRDVRIEPRSKN